MRCFAVTRCSFPPKIILQRVLQPFVQHSAPIADVRGENTISSLRHSKPSAYDPLNAMAIREQVDKGVAFGNNAVTTAALFAAPCAIKATVLIAASVS